MLTADVALPTGARVSVSRDTCVVGRCGASGSEPCAISAPEGGAGFVVFTPYAESGAEEEEASPGVRFENIAFEDFVFKGETAMAAAVTMTTTTTSRSSSS